VRVSNNVPLLPVDSAATCLLLANAARCEQPLKDGAQVAVSLKLAFDCRRLWWPVTWLGPLCCMCVSKLNRCYTTPWPGGRAPALTKGLGRSRHHKHQYMRVLSAAADKRMASRPIAGRGAEEGLDVQA
jgi:hypothetical protein